MDEHVVSLLHLSPDDQRTVARRRRDEQPGSLLERPSIGNGQNGGLLGADLCRKRTLRGTEDARADGEPALGGCTQDGARELSAGGPWKSLKVSNVSI